jgi:AraC family transcriptional regulator of adaptative response / DNA-3-methyladenine glycosylase II
MIRRTTTFRPPIAWDLLLSFLAARAVRGVEHIDEGAYARTVRIDGHTGVLRATLLDATGLVGLDVSPSLAKVLPAIVARARHLFDLDANTDEIEAHLANAKVRLVTDRTRGLRVPGAFDGFELALRAVLGQQVTVKGASTLMARLVIAFGEETRTSQTGLTHLTPTPQRIAAASVPEIRTIGLPMARAATLLALASAVASGALVIDTNSDVPELTRRLRALPGIGPWTAEYIVMRAAHWPDAFPVGDIALRRAAGNVSAGELLRMADEWRPWRAYAAMHLWSNSGHGG